MSIKSVPKYSLEFFFPNPEIKIETPEQLLIRTKELSPPTTTIAPRILEMIENLCKDYICSLGEIFKEPIKVRMSFSPSEGITFDHEKIRKVYEEITKDVAVALPKKDAQSMGVHHLKKKQVSLEGKKEAAMRFGSEPLVFLDREAYLLWTSGVRNRLAIDVDMHAPQEVKGAD